MESTNGTSNVTHFHIHIPQNIQSNVFTVNLNISRSPEKTSKYVIKKPVHHDKGQPKFQFPARYYTKLSQQMLLDDKLEHLKPIEQTPDASGIWPIRKTNKQSQSELDNSTFTFGNSRRSEHEYPEPLSEPPNLNCDNLYHPFGPPNPNCKPAPSFGPPNPNSKQSYIPFGPPPVNTAPPLNTAALKRHCDEHKNDDTEHPKKSLRVGKKIAVGTKTAAASSMGTKTASSSMGTKTASSSMGTKTAAASSMGTKTAAASMGTKTAAASMGTKTAASSSMEFPRLPTPTI